MLIRCTGIQLKPISSRLLWCQIRNLLLPQNCRNLRISSWSQIRQPEYSRTKSKLNIQSVQRSTTMRSRNQKLTSSLNWILNYHFMSQSARSSPNKTIRIFSKTLISGSTKAIRNAKRRPLTLDPTGTVLHWTTICQGLKSTQNTMAAFITQVVVIFSLESIWMHENGSISALKLTHNALMATSAK